MIRSNQKSFQFVNALKIAIGLHDMSEIANAVHDAHFGNRKFNHFTWMLMHFSLNCYDKDLKLSDDNPYFEMQGYTSTDKKTFQEFWNIDFSHNFTKASFKYFKAKVLEKGFAQDTSGLYNVFKNCTNTNENIFFDLEVNDLKEAADIFIFIRNTFLEACAIDWEELLKKDNNADCPLEVLALLKPKLKTAIDIGVMENVHIKRFDQFNDSRVWDLKRKAVKPHNMPNVARQNDYLQTVKEEISNVLKNIYNFSNQNIDTIQNAIWLTFKNDWQDILDDSLVNWDTPNVCAQKCLTRMKEFIPELKEA